VATVCGVVGVSGVSLIPEMIRGLQLASAGYNL
jgi:hypothetical protein